MKSALIGIAVAATMLTTTSVHAELAVETVGRGGVAKIATAPGFEIKAFFADHTFIMNSRNSTQAYPWDGPAFVYFAPNGRIALWRGWDGSGVFGGKWEAGWLGDNETLLCMDFDDVDQGGRCVVLKSAGTLIQKRVAGNVLKLKVGAPGPLRIGRHQVDFAYVAKKLGL